MTQKVAAYIAAMVKLPRAETPAVAEFSPPLSKLEMEKSVTAPPSVSNEVVDEVDPMTLLLVVISTPQLLVEQLALYFC